MVLAKLANVERIFFKNFNDFKLCKFYALFNSNTKKYIKFQNGIILYIFKPNTFTIKKVLAENPSCNKSDIQIHEFELNRSGILKTKEQEKQESKIEREMINELKDVKFKYGQNITQEDIEKIIGYSDYSNILDKNTNKDNPFENYDLYLDI